MWTDITRAKHARKGLRYSSDLTDGEWAVLEPELPVPARLGRPPKWTRREIMNGVFYVLRSGLPWRMLPSDFPPVSTVQRYFYALARQRPLDHDQPPPAHGFASVGGIDITPKLFARSESSGCSPRGSLSHLFPRLRLIAPD